MLKMRVVGNKVVHRESDSWLHTGSANMKLNKMQFPRVRTFIVMGQEAGEDLRGGIVTV